MTVLTGLKWSILIPTTDVRVMQFEKLVHGLLDQASVYPDIEIVAYFNRRAMPVGDIRQALVKDAQGQYVSFIDDDDAVSESYCAKIYPHLDGTNDCVGFKTEITINRGVTRPVFNTLRVQGWSQIGSAYYRDVNYLCAIKRSKYRGVKFPSANCYEDLDWASQMRGKLKYEHFINETLYYYDCNYETSLTQNPNPRLDLSQPRAVIEHPQFRYHPDSEQ